MRLLALCAKDLTRKMKLPKTLAVVSACALCACTSTQQTLRSNSPQDSASWVNQTMQSLTLEQKIGQMLMGRLEGDFDNVNGPELQRARDLIRRLGMGGFSIGLGSPAEVAVKTNALQGFSPLPLLIAADLEWGSAMRLWRPTYLPYGMEGGGGTAFPFNMGIGATGEPAFADTAGRITGEEARAVGINWVFAPVLDVNTDPANPIVNVRAYSSDPVTVARFGAAFIRGATKARVLTSAKHFPGHGDTNLDSHVELPVVAAGARRIDSLELLPFREAVKAGVSSVMVGHLALPNIIGDSITPASISPRVGESLLRQRLRFSGLIVTDALTMGALRKVPGYTPGEVAVRAVLAGADVVLSPPDLEQAHAGILAAVRSGRISEARIDESVRRILGAKAWLGINRDRFVPVEQVDRIVASPENEAAARNIAQRSITLVRDADNLIPLDPRRVRKIAFIAYGANNDIGAGRTLANELRSIYGDDVSYLRVDEGSNRDVIERAGNQAANADAVIYGIFLMPIAGQGHIEVPMRARELGDRIAQANKPTVVVSFGDPYGPAALTIAGTYIAAWQPRALHAQIAAAHAIAGIAPITGRLPIEMPNAPRGTGVMRTVLNTGLIDDPKPLPQIDSIINAAIADRATPGAALAIVHRGRLLKLQGYGRLDYRSGFDAVTDSSLYDLASLTKVIGTTTAAMILADEGKLDINAPISRYLPEFLDHPDKTNIKVRNLLLHNAGFRAFAPLYRTATGREQYLKGILDLPLDYQTGARMVYSDFSMITLALAIERLSGQPIDQFLQQRVFGPLGMRDTRYNPDPSLLRRIAPTEIDTIFRKTHVHGVVHDENAFAIGGVSGHAGLFSSARDLAKFGQMLLNGGYYGGRRYISPATVSQFTKRQGEQSSRGLGWDTDGNKFGHTGFTGTSIWADPENQVLIVLLTNRVNPTRDNQKIAPLRRAVADAVANSIRD